MAPSFTASCAALYAFAVCSDGMWQTAWDKLADLPFNQRWRDRPAEEEEMPVHRSTAEDASGAGPASDETSEGWGWRFTWAAGTGGFAEWFSTQERPGRLQRDGGWLLYFLDSLGLKLFGLAWPLTACVGMFAFMAGLMGL